MFHFACIVQIDFYFSLKSIEIANLQMKSKDKLNNFIKTI